MSTLVPSFRYPANVPDDAAHPSVVKAVNQHTRGINDLNQAIVALKSQIIANEPINTTTTVVAANPNPSVLPGNTPAIAHEWIDAYAAASGMFTQTQPAFTDISGTLSTAQLPANVPVVSFGSGAPSGSSTEGYLYFDTSGSPYNGYVFHSAAWHQFS